MTWSEQLVEAAVIAWAMGLGMAVGLERELSAKAAGTRTMALVAGAAALVVLLGDAVLDADGIGDSTRALHGVMTGIGFLGAGTIVHSSTGVASGLTTAASVFTVAALGAAVGLGYGILATAVTVLILIVLQGLGRLFPTGADVD